MRSLTGNSRRRAFVAVVLIGTLGIVLMFVVLMARLAMLEFGFERQSMLDTRAQLVVASAQEWCGLHVDQLTGEPVRLPVEDLLPAELTGEVELRRIVSDDGAEQIECDLSLRSGGHDLDQRFVWPVPVFAGGGPAVP